VCAWLSKSPTLLCKTPELVQLAKMSKECCFEIWGAMKKTPKAEQVEAASIPTFIVELEMLLTEICKQHHTKESTEALGDDKVPVSGRKASENGLNAKKIKDSFGPVIHGVVSVLTRLFVTAQLERKGDKVKKVIDVLMTNLGNTNVPYNVSHPQLDHGRSGLRTMTTDKRSFAKERPYE
jgi:hypothetical protein